MATKKKAAKKAAKKKAAKKSPRKVGKFPKPSADEVVRLINMKYGDVGPIIRPGNAAWDASDLRRPSGIASLDVETGGGLVAGKVHQFDGPESTGKNYMLYRYFAQVQRNYGDEACLAMACFESFVDKHFAQMCGCRIAMSRYDIDVTQRARELRGEEPLTKAEIKEAMECPGVGKFHIFEGPSENVLSGIVEAVEANIYQIIGIDSWDSMLTAPEDKAALGEVPQVASPATLQTRWAKKVLDAFNPIHRCPECGYAPVENKVTNYDLMNFKYECKHCGWKGEDPEVEVNETSLYCIRQVRAKIQMSGGKVYGRPYDSKGAFSLQHLNHIRVSLHGGSPLRDGKIKIGKEVNWEISKAKAGAREGATGSFILYFKPLEVDVQGDLLAQCIKYGVVLKETGGWYSTPGIDMDRIHGEEKFLQLMEQEPELMDSLREDLYVKAGLAHVRFV